MDEIEFTDKDTLKEDLVFSTENDFVIRFSTQCGCFSCLTKFKPNKIKTWSDEGTTAHCPHCDKATVLPDSMVEINKQYLTKMRKYFVKCT